MTANNKTIAIVLGLAGVAGLVWYISKNKTGVLPSSTTATPTYKKTADSTLQEMKTDLLAWAVRNDSDNWGGKKPAVASAVIAEGDAAIRNMHALLWDIWQAGTVENYAYKVDSYLRPAAWDNSVGKWWELFTIRHGF